MDQNCRILLTKDKIEVEDALKFVTSPNCGATSIFIGSTRNNENCDDERKNVQYLIYEAYEEMALSEIKQIVLSNLSMANELHKVYVSHRIGKVRLCEVSILIAVSSPHRSSGHKTVMQILNEIKQKAPIWKQVCYDVKQNEIDTSSDWSENSEAFWLKQ